MTNPVQLNVVSAPVDSGRRGSASGLTQLAQTLGQIAPIVDTVYTKIHTDYKERGEREGQQAAMSQQGQAFADAVREGKLEKTQNPFFIQSYNREASSISGRKALTDLQVQSQTWEERSDPKAFQKRWAEEANTVAQGFKSKDQFAGFEPVLKEVSSQVLNQQTAESVHRIVQQRDNNTQLLISQQIQDITAPAGMEDPQAVLDSLKDLRESYVGTGGSDEDWDKLVIAGVQAAAYGSTDAEILDVLKAGENPLYNKTGVAEQIETDRFRIEQAKERQSQVRAQQMRDQATLEGLEATDKLYAQFGDSVLTGTLDLDAARAWMTKEGINSRAQAAAFSQAQGAAADFQSLGKMKATSGTVGVDAVKLYNRARTDGYTKRLENEILAKVSDGTMSSDEGQQIMGTAYSKTESEDSKAAAAAKKNRDATQRNIESVSGLRSEATAMAKNLFYELDAQLTGANAEFLSAHGISESADMEALFGAYVTRQLQAGASIDRVIGGMDEMYQQWLTKAPEWTTPVRSKPAPAPAPASPAKASKGAS